VRGPQNDYRVVCLQQYGEASNHRAGFFVGGLRQPECTATYTINPEHTVQGKDGMNRPLVFGEVLFDEFPNGEAVRGGAPFNVAWHLQGFGLSPLLVTRVGDDEPGRDIRAAMTAWGMDQAGVQIDCARPTGKVIIKMGEAGHQFEILPDQAYDHIDQRGLPSTIASKPNLLYHGSLVARTEQVSRVLSVLIEGARAPVFIDVNLRDPWWREGELRAMLTRARWAKVNDEELEQLATQRSGTLEETARRFRAAYHLALLIVTRGAQGALAVDAADQVCTTTPERDIEITDTVGAGDAFCSVVLVGLLQNWPLETLLARAQTFASRVCGMRGATSAASELYGEAQRQWNTGA
jgi:fructokinase